jgi:4-hydroxy-4-methyl-2-oxoglutarate aldolase
MSSPEELARVGSSQVSDCLDAVGVRGRVVRADIAPVRAGMSCAGAAATVELGPAAGASGEGADDPQQDPYGEMIALIDGLRPGEVVVIATAGSRASAVWGELFSCAAVGHGALGVVTDAPLRDRSAIAELGFPAFGAGRSPSDYRGRQRVVSRRSPVRLGGVLVNDGDLVVADDDGVVIVPTDRATDVIRAASARSGRENTVREGLLGGASLREMWVQHRVL